jgi:uncharacterized membrane protein YeaQ/YmgE (transglycosylase-associated protein family)
MDPRRTVFILMIIGGYIGGYVPQIWGAAGFSFASLFGNAIGALIGIWIGFKLTH